MREIVTPEFSICDKCKRLFQNNFYRIPDFRCYTCSCKNPEYKQSQVINRVATPLAIYEKEKVFLEL